MSTSAGYPFICEWRRTQDWYANFFLPNFGLVGQGRFFGCPGFCAVTSFNHAAQVSDCPCRDEDLHRFRVRGYYQMSGLCLRSGLQAPTRRFEIDHKRSAGRLLHARPAFGGSLHLSATGKVCQLPHFTPSAIGVPCCHEQNESRRKIRQLSDRVHDLRPRFL